jgi:hypothetical protein
MSFFMNTSILSLIMMLSAALLSACSTQDSTLSQDSSEVQSPKELDAVLELVPIAFETGKLDPDELTVRLESLFAVYKDQLSIAPLPSLPKEETLRGLKNLDFKKDDFGHWNIAVHKQQFAERQPKLTLMRKKLTARSNYHSRRPPRNEDCFIITTDDIELDFLQGCVVITSGSVKIKEGHENVIFSKADVRIDAAFEKGDQYPSIVFSKTYSGKIFSEVIVRSLDPAAKVKLQSENATIESLSVVLDDSRQSERDLNRIRAYAANGSSVSIKYWKMITGFVERDGAGKYTITARYPDRSEAVMEVVGDQKKIIKQ